MQNQSTANGAKILQWDDNGTLDHEWAVVPNPADGYTLTNRVTGKNLEIPGASTATGTSAGQWSDTGCACLVNKSSGKYLDIPAASTATNTAAQQYQNSACLCQLFTFQSAGGGAWTIIRTSTTPASRSTTSPPARTGSLMW